MKVLGIYTFEALFSDKLCKLPIFSFHHIPLGLTAILTEIENKNNIVETLAISQYTNIDIAIKSCEIDAYDLICFTSVTTQIELVYKTAGKIRKFNKYAKIIIGGPHATLCPEDVIKHKEFDALCIGEGFKTIHSYIGYLNGKNSINEVPGFWIRQNQTIVKNEKAHFANFAEFPLVNRKLWNKWVKDHSFHMVIILRGCSNNCSFCSNHKLRKCNLGEYISFRKIEDIVQEIKFIIEQYKDIQTIHLEAESFAMNLEFTYALFKALRIFNNTVKFSFNIHLAKEVQKDINNFIIALKLINVNFICIGLESGSYRIRKRILHRPDYTNYEFIKFCKTLTRHNISVNVMTMLGLPTETEKNLKQTVSILKKINPYKISHSIFFPLKNTDIYDAMIKMNLITAKTKLNPYRERKTARISYPGLPKETIQKYFNYLTAIVDKKRHLLVEKQLYGNNNTF